MPPSPRATVPNLSIPICKKNQRPRQTALALGGFVPFWTLSRTCHTRPTGNRSFILTLHSCLLNSPPKHIHTIFPISSSALWTINDLLHALIIIALESYLAAPSHPPFPPSLFLRRPAPSCPASCFVLGRTSPVRPHLAPPRHQKRKSIFSTIPKLERAGPFPENRKPKYAYRCFFGSRGPTHVSFPFPIYVPRPAPPLPSPSLTHPARPPQQGMWRRLAGWKVGGLEGWRVDGGRISRFISFISRVDLSWQAGAGIGIYHPLNFFPRSNIAHFDQTNKTKSENDIAPLVAVAIHCHILTP